MTLTTTILVVILLVTIFLSVISLTWGVHLSMMIDEKRSRSLKVIYTHVSYKDYKSLFDSVEWFMYNVFPNSIFGANNSSCHADIFTVNDEGFMFVNPITYFRVKYLVHKKIKQLKKDIRVATYKKTLDE